MPNFTLLAFVDVFELTCSLRPRMHLFPAPDEKGRRILNIRWPDDPEAEALRWLAHKETRKWVELKNTRTRIMDLGSKILPRSNLQLGRIFFEMLDPNAILAWSCDNSEYSRRYSRMRLPLRTNPAAMLYAGLESTILWPGQLTLVRNAMSSAVNFGEHPVIHLILDVRAESNDDSN